MPPGFLTEDGPKPEYAEEFGMKETDDLGSATRNYSHRTGRNVFDSDGTLCVASDFSSPGERCTSRAIDVTGKPSLRIKFIPNSKIKFIPHDRVKSSQIIEVADWIEAKNISILNVAGNRESTAPGISEFTKQLIREVIEELKQRELQNAT